MPQPLPLVSIIIPCYNYGHLIHETLQSVQNQSLTNWECLVIDDGSSDNIADVVNEFSTEDNRIRIISQSNGGQSKARNNGLKHASGKYIQFLDADDLLQHNKLMTQISYLQANPTVDVVYSEVRYFESDTPHIVLLSRDGKNKYQFPNISGKGHHVLDYFLYQNPFELGSALFRKEIFNSIREFDEAIKGVEDWDLVFRIAAANYHLQFFQQEDSYILMRYHAGSFSTSSTKMTAAYLKLKQKMLLTIFNNNLFPYLSNKEKALQFFAKYMRRLLQDRKYIRGLYHLLKLLKETGQFSYYSRLYFREVKF